MSLKPFTYPFPETRFFHAGLNVYKFKIRYGDSIRGEEIEDKEVIIQELEDSIRAVLANLDNLQPFVTEHFIVFPYKSKWERVSHLKFKQGEIILVPYPFVFTLYVEMKWFNENFSPGKPENIPLELVLDERKAADTPVRKRKLMEEPHPPSRARMETSNQGSSKKKPPLETRKREEAAQHQYEEIPTSKTIDIWEQDSECEHSLPGPIVPPPKEPGASGFFGFLSTLFPFRYFFSKKSSQ